MCFRVLMTSDPFCFLIDSLEGCGQDRKWILHGQEVCVCWSGVPGHPNRKQEITALTAPPDLRPPSPPEVRHQRDAHTLSSQLSEPVWFLNHHQHLPFKHEGQGPVRGHRINLRGRNSITGRKSLETRSSDFSLISSKCRNEIGTIKTTVRPQRRWWIGCE